jgi:hypothetical protein
MDTITWKTLFIFIVSQTSNARAKILISQHENWSHAVEKVFNKYNISLYKIHFSKDGTCPTFYANFESSPNPKTASAIDYQKIYSEILKANANWPYALVDKKENIKINVGWTDKTRKVMAVDFNKASSPSTCKGNSHANIDDHADFDKYTISEELKKRILSSPYKAPMRRNDGKQFIAYLYAQKIKSKLKNHLSCESNDFVKYEEKIGNYYIYLYDPTKDTFFPGRIEIFNDLYKTITNIPGADFFAVHPGKNQSDILLVSQESGCDDDDYEAYSFSDKHSFLKKYAFASKKRYDSFNGLIKKENEGDKLIAVDGNLKKLHLSFSKIPGELKLDPVLAEANLNTSYSVEPFIVNAKLKKQILLSSFKLLLHRKDGKEVTAYLFAEDEKKWPHTKGYCDGYTEQKTLVKSGHYYIYLYDANADTFSPYRTAIFKDYKITRLSTKGSHFLLFPHTNKNQTDVILISQFIACNDNLLETYGLSENQQYLVPYIFSGKKKEGAFFGELDKSKPCDHCFSAYTKKYPLIYKYSLSLSNTPGEIQQELG